jgi:hypothetical protein
MNSIDFARNLVKGKIAETVFAQMLRETQTFIVLEFGYEKVVPELVQQGYPQDTGIIETLRSAPDFAVINQETKKVHLIEVKYLRNMNHKYVLGYATRMAKSWNPSYLFVATLDGFYFGEINEIIQSNGAIEPLQHAQIENEMQKKYLQILQDFEKRN